MYAFSSIFQVRYRAKISCPGCPVLKPKVFPPRRIDGTCSLEFTKPVLVNPLLKQGDIKVQQSSQNSKICTQIHRGIEICFERILGSMPKMSYLAKSFLLKIIFTQY